MKKPQKETRKRNYLVGYRGERQVAYGKSKNGRVDWAEPMTLNQARKYAKSQMMNTKCFIYELVPVEEVKKEIY
jgi:hypothetical protein